MMHPTLYLLSELRGARVELHDARQDDRYQPARVDQLEAEVQELDEALFEGGECGSPIKWRGHAKLPIRGCDLDRSEWTWDADAQRWNGAEERRRLSDHQRSGWWLEWGGAEWPPFDGIRFDEVGDFVTLHWDGASWTTRAAELIGVVATASPDGRHVGVHVPTEPVEIEMRFDPSMIAPPVPPWRID